MCLWNVLSPLGLAGDILRHREADVLRWRRRHVSDNRYGDFNDSCHFGLVSAVLHFAIDFRMVYGQAEDILVSDSGVKHLKHFVAVGGFGYAFFARPPKPVESIRCMWI